jgi:small-conductance mechanosensitive channel
MMAAIEQILRDHPKVDPTSVPTRFTKIGSEGFQVEIFAYVLTPDSDEFLKVQTSLLLQILEKAEELGVRFAIPLQESILNPDGLKGTGAGADQIVGERAKNGGGHELDTPLAIRPSAR